MRHITIRKLVDADAKAIHEAVMESRKEVGEWMDWCHDSYGAGDARVWVELTSSWHKEGSQFQFGIFEVDGRFLGGVGLSQINHQAKCANLGYWVRTSAAGQGVAPEAVRQITKWAFANTDLQRLEVVVAATNVRSIRVAEKTGAIKEGVLRSRICIFGRHYDGVMYSIVRGDI